MELEISVLRISLYWAPTIAMVLGVNCTRGNFKKAEMKLMNFLISNKLFLNIRVGAVGIQQQVHRMVL